MTLPPLPLRLRLRDICITMVRSKSYNVVLVWKHLQYVVCWNSCVDYKLSAPPYIWLYPSICHNHWVISLLFSWHFLSIRHILSWKENAFRRGGHLRAVRRLVWKDRGLVELANCSPSAYISNTATQSKSSSSSNFTLMYSTIYLCACMGPGGVTINTTRLTRNNMRGCVRVCVRACCAS